MRHNLEAMDLHGFQMGDLLEQVAQSKIELVKPGLGLVARDCVVDLCNYLANRFIGKTDRQDILLEARVEAIASRHLVLCINFFEPNVRVEFLVDDV